MNWFVFALGTVLFWGIGQIFIKKGLSSLSPLWSNIIGTIIIVFIYIPTALLSGERFSINPYAFLIVLLGAILYILYYYALDNGQISITGTIIAMYPVITILLAVVFLKESLSILQISMILLILLGGYLLAQHNGNKTNIKSSWVMWAVMGALAIGTADFLAKVVIDQTNASTYNLLFPLASAFGLVFYWILDKKGRKLPKKINAKYFWPTLIGVTCMNLGLLSFNYALASGPASLVSTVSSSYIGVTILLAYLFLKESLTKKQTLAIILMTIGIIFVNFG